MTQEEFLTRLHQVVENKKQHIESVQFKIKLQILEEINNRNYANKTDLVNLVEDFFSNSINTYLQNAWQKFNSKQFYLYNNQDGLENLSIPSGMCIKNGNFLLAIDNIKLVYCNIPLSEEFFDETLTVILKEIYENILKEEVLPSLISLIEQNATVQQQ